MLWKKESIRNDAPLIDIFANQKHERVFRLFDDDSESKEVLEKNEKLSKHYRKKAVNQFEAKNLPEAIELLNEALCFAKNDSDDVGCVYAQRSMCFFNLHQYEKCLTDIKLARSNNCPLPFQTKLKQLSESCKKMLKAAPQPQSDEQFELKLSFDANKLCPSIANVIQVESNEKLGRHINATRDIGVGQTIMVEEGFVWSTTENYRRCCVCLKTTTNLVPCKNCADSLMCHGKCENDELHDIECKMALNKHKSNEINSYLVVRSILMALQTIPNVNELIRFVERVVYGEDHKVVNLVSTPLSRYAVFLENGLKWQWPKKESKLHCRHAN